MAGALLTQGGGERDQMAASYTTMQELRDYITGNEGTKPFIEPKEEFKEQYGFSPDLLDCLCQGALYMLLVRHLPLTAIGNDVKLHEDPEIEDKTFHEDLWREDDLSEIGV